MGEGPARVEYKSDTAIAGGSHTLAHQGLDHGDHHGHGALAYSMPNAGPTLAV